MAPWHHVFVRTGVALAALAAFLSVGFLGVYRYVDGYWLYRGFPRPHDPAFVHLFGRAVRIEVASSAACRRAVTARSTSRSTIPASSASSRAGRATRRPTTSARSSVTNARSWR